MKELNASESIKLLERFLVDLFKGYFCSALLLEKKSITLKHIQYYNLKTGFLRFACRNGAVQRLLGEPFEKITKFISF